VDDVVRGILNDFKRVAVVGMSKNPAKKANEVPGYLWSHGFTIIPINPTASQIMGLRSYPSLADAEDDFDVVVVFRPAGEAVDIVKQAIARKEARGDVKAVWLQLGLVNDEAKALARSAGLLFVQDRCMMREHERLFG